MITKTGESISVSVVPVTDDVTITSSSFPNARLKAVINKIKNMAKSNKLKIITTEKDYNRLSNIQKKNIQFLKIGLKIEKEKEFKNFLLKKL